MNNRKFSIIFRRLGILVEPDELSALAWSLIYFFCLLCGYYLLRPLREEMGIQSGLSNLPWLFSATFIAMLLLVPVFGYLTKRFTRKKFLPITYAFFILNVLLFYFLFTFQIQVKVVAKIFFVWLSVYNVFVVSVFWSFMVDIFSKTQSKRLFGLIAAGGSAGAIAGPMLTTALVTSIGPLNLLLIAAILLSLSTLSVCKLLNKSVSNPHDHKPMGGSVFGGIKSFFSSPYLSGIGLLIILYSAVSTFLYFEQAHIVASVLADSAERTRFFSGVDLGTNILAISTQIFFTGKFLQKFGLAITLCLIPAVVAAGFLLLSHFAFLSVIMVVQIIHRAGNFSLLRPGKEVLFTVVSAEDKYKTKNFMDTTIFRGGDALTGWAFAILAGIGLSLGAIALIAVPIAAFWSLAGYWIGRKSDNTKILPSEVIRNVNN